MSLYLLVMLVIKEYITFNGVVTLNGVLVKSGILLTLHSDTCSIVITCLESADLLALLCLLIFVFLSLFHMVSRVRCGT